MGLLAMLSTLGDRLGIVERSSDSEDPVARKVRMRTVTLAELTGEIRQEEVRALADEPEEEVASPDSIYAAAGIETASHGWSIARLARTLATDSYKGLDREEIQKRVVDLLTIAKVPSEDLVRDAVSRDQALDAYDGGVRRKHEEMQATGLNRIAEIESRIREMQSEAERIRRHLAAEDDRWRAWRSAKVQEEKMLARTVSVLIDRPVISVDEEY